jgi:DNA-binding response OmpR family regulator
MQVVFIGADPLTSELARSSVRLYRPDATMLVATTAAEGLRLVEQEAPDVVILHPGFSDISLAETLQELRSISSVPLLVLGQDESEVVPALEMGADGYIYLPCSPRQIAVRIQALLRRRGVFREEEV